MRATRRAFVSTGAAALTINLNLPAFAQQRTLRIGDTAALPMAWPVYIADKKGYLAESGLKIEITYTNSNPAEIGRAHV